MPKPNWGGAASGALGGAGAGAAFGPWGALAGGLIGGAAGFFGGGQEKEKNEYIPNLTPEQQRLHDQAVAAGLSPGAGGAFGESADYYRDLLSNDPQALHAYMAPALRQYNEEIVPGLSEQFAGMGAGGLSSSGFRNAQVQGATDLAERIGMIRGNLRQQGAQGLTNIGNIGLQPIGQYQTTQQGSPGMWGDLGKVAGNAAPFALQAGSDWLKNKWGSPGGTNTGTNMPPYQSQWNNVPASPGGF